VAYRARREKPIDGCAPVLYWHSCVPHVLALNAAIRIMPHDLRQRLVFRASAIRLFGIIRALPRTPGVGRRAGTGLTEWTEPRRGRGPSPSSACQRGCRSVAQRMRCNPLGADARTSVRCREAVLADQMFKRIAAQPFTPDRREQRPALVFVVADPRASSLAVSRRSGVARSFRPLPMHRMCAPLLSMTSPIVSPTSSDARRPV
jgi:hypothetical protein